MKSILALAIQTLVCTGLLFSSSSIFGQVITPKTIPVSAPVIVNYTTLANYQLSHPVTHTQRMVEQGDDDEREQDNKIKPDTNNKRIFTMHNATSSRSTTPSPAPRIVFNAITSNYTGFPVDINGAVGNTYVVETSNQQFNIYTKNGTLVNTLELPTFFSELNGFHYFDPRVEYDIANQRYIISCDGQLASDSDYAVFIAVSQTNDPTGNWYSYYIEAAGSSNNLLDYPQLGYNENWVVITANYYVGSGEENYVYVLTRTALYNGTLNNVSEFSNGGLYSIAPAQTYDANEDSVYLVTDAGGNSAGYGYVQLGCISGSVSNPSWTMFPGPFGINYPWSDDGSIGATQLGSSTNIESGLDTKIQNVIYKNGSLWFTHTVYLPASAPTHCAVDWWQVNPSNTNFNILKFERIEDPNGIIDYYYPSINVDAKGDALVGYTTSSPNIYAGSQYTYFPYNTTSMDEGYTFKPGLSSYVYEGSGTRNRWGDYSYTAFDPVDSSFWTFQEYAAYPQNTWGTVIANIGGVACNDKPAAGYIEPITDSVCNATILKLKGYPNVNGISFLWQQSPDGSNWVASTGGYDDSSSIYSTGPLTANTYFRCIVVCSNSGLSDTALPVRALFQPIGGEDLKLCTGTLYKLVAAGGGPNSQWYLTDTSTTPFHVGSYYETKVSSDTTFYIVLSTPTQYEIGISDTSLSTGAYGVVGSNGLLFSTVSNFTLDSFYVYPLSTGTLSVDLINTATGATSYTNPLVITNKMVKTPTVVHTNYNCIGGTNYEITATGTTTALFYTTSNAAYPYVVPGVLSINGPVNSYTGYYYFFYDWHITLPCYSNRVPLNITAQDCTGIDGIVTTKPDIKVYPNPTSDEVFININSSVAATKDYSLQITDVLGRTVYTKSSLDYTNVIDLSKLPDGVYFISATNTTERTTIPLVKQ